MCPPMHCLAMDALLLRIHCREMCLPVCYLAMDLLLLLDACWLECVYLFISQKWPNLSQYISVIKSHKYVMHLSAFANVLYFLMTLTRCLCVPFCYYSIRNKLQLKKAMPLFLSDKELVSFPCIIS
jgi:hypothetical protein